jgi:hypothetical protein
MPDDRTQLKEEEVVGNEVVLSDINPKTNTRSVDDVSSGETMEVVLEQVWNAINNKLSRIVNSVNGRTGVVVLDAEDVGLGNVDNVSFSDIKDWVLQQLEIWFGNKRIHLYQNIAEAIADVDQYGDILKDAPFYCEQFSSDEQRACIGYFTADGSDTPYRIRYIDTIGYTDHSIIYNENLGEDKDFHGGGIGINIWEYEDALQLYSKYANDSTITKMHDGLMIDKTKIAGNVYYVNGLYGCDIEGKPSVTNCFLYPDYDSETQISGGNVYLTIHDFNEPDTKYDLIQGTLNPYFCGYEKDEDGNATGRYAILKKGDILIFNFRDYRNSATGMIHTGDMNIKGIYRNPGIGFVSVHKQANGSHEYRIDVYQILQEAGLGLHYDANYENNGSSVHDKELSISIVNGSLDEEYHYANISGLELVKSNQHPNQNDVTGNTINYTTPGRLVVTPLGLKQYTVDADKNGGLMIRTDQTLCVQPLNDYGYNVTTDHSKKIINWSLPFNASTPEPGGKWIGYTEELCFLGININKTIKELSSEEKEDNDISYDGTIVKISNSSGLRIASKNHTIVSDNVLGDSVTMFYGVTKQELIDAGYHPDTTDDEYDLYQLTDAGNISGGLAVNVGKFLSIDLPNFSADQYSYESGKLNVRIGKGLIGETETFEGSKQKKTRLTGNRIQVNTGENGPIDFDENDALTINPGNGVRIYQPYHSDKKTISVNIESNHSGLRFYPWAYTTDTGDITDGDTGFNDGEGILMVDTGGVRQGRYSGMHIVRDPIPTDDEKQYDVDINENYDDPRNYRSHGYVAIQNQDLLKDLLVNTRNDVYLYDKAQNRINTKLIIKDQNNKQIQYDPVIADQSTMLISTIKLGPGLMIVPDEYQRNLELLHGIATLLCDLSWAQLEIYLKQLEYFDSLTLLQKFYNVTIGEDIEESDLRYKATKEFATTTIKELRDGVYRLYQYALKPDASDNTILPYFGTKKIEKMTNTHMRGIIEDLKLEYPKRHVRRGYRETTSNMAKSPFADRGFWRVLYGNMSMTTSHKSNICCWDVFEKAKTESATAYDLLDLMETYITDTFSDNKKSELREMIQNSQLESFVSNAWAVFMNEIEKEYIELIPALWRYMNANGIGYNTYPTTEEGYDVNNYDDTVYPTDATDDSSESSSEDSSDDEDGCGCGINCKTEIEALKERVTTLEEKVDTIDDEEENGGE